MSKRLISLIVLTIIFLVSCGSSLDNPPLVYLLADGDLMDGFQSSYCWDQGIGAAICVDTVEPYFDETTHLPNSAPIRFQLDIPLPDEVTISISEELFGETIFSESISPAEMIDWSPAIPPGEYIIDVHVSWKQGDVAYWFSVLLE